VDEPFVRAQVNVGSAGGDARDQPFVELREERNPSDVLRGNQARISRRTTQRRGLA
jgi:hypothetical protein